MVERKPAGVSWESFVDRQIREAQERGEFENLPGAGKPIHDLHRPHDELWWLRRKLKEEGLSYLPPTLRLRRDVEDARQRLSRARSEREARTIVTELNDHIRYVNRTVLDGPPSGVMPLDEETTIARWRAEQAREGGGGGEPRTGAAARDTSSEDVSSPRRRRVPWRR